VSASRAVTSVSYEGFCRRSGRSRTGLCQCWKLVRKRRGIIPFIDDMT
jgi:hypothetical protein